MLWAALIVALAVVVLGEARRRGAVAALERRLSEKKEVTVLFADLEGFTPLAERLDPALLVHVLNGFFERMSGAISAHRGHVAKFLGDGLLALFGALEANPWHTHDAVDAALAMRAALADYNRTLVAEGLPSLAMGIGIHRGMAVTGVMGSTELAAYDAVGSTVNLASRVQDLTRTHRVDILITEPARAALDQHVRVRAMPAVEVKGVAAMLPTWAVEGFGAEAGTTAR